MALKYYKDYPLSKNIKWNFLDVSRAMKNFFVRLKYRFNGGYICSECGVTIPIYYTELHSYANGKRMIISNSGKELICPHCLGEKIETFFANADLDSDKCDWYPDSTKTLGIIGKHFGSQKNQDLAEDLGLDIRFGSSWWNGYHACNYAFQTALMSDKLEYGTGFSKYDGEKIFTVDRYGIKMERKAWLT